MRYKKYVIFNINIDRYKFIEKSIDDIGIIQVRRMRFVLRRVE